MLYGSSVWVTAMVSVLPAPPPIPSNPDSFDQFHVCLTEKWNIKSQQQEYGHIHPQNYFVTTSS